MATTIYQQIQNPNCVAESFQTAQNILQTYASSSDGYKILKQLLRFVHPRLNSQDVLREQPKLSKFSDIFSYADAMHNYILDEHVQGRNYNDNEQSLMFYQYIDIETYFSAKQPCIDGIIFSNTWSSANSKRRPPHGCISHHCRKVSRSDDLYTVYWRHFPSQPALDS